MSVNISKKWKVMSNFISNILIDTLLCNLLLIILVAKEISLDANSLAHGQNLRGGGLIDSYLQCNCIYLNKNTCTCKI